MAATRGRVRIGAGVLAVLVAGAAVWAAVPRQRNVEFLVGRYKQMPTPTPVSKPPPPLPPQPDRVPAFSAAPARGPSGQAPGPPLPYDDGFHVPSDLHFFLVIGSDARPGQDIARARADSIHIAAVDPVSRKGTILGIPRDSYVEIPGHGRRKILAALPYGGPDLLVQTVRDLTKLPVSFYAVTGFEGMVRMVDEMGGLDVEVPYEMRDRYSGADFSPGWHHMDGQQVLAFCRARHGVPGGDIGRSYNHGRVMLHTLEKLRAETSDRAGVETWMKLLYDHAQLNMSIKDAFELGSLARALVPSDLVNIVAPGVPATIDGQSVIVLGEEAEALFRDVGANAVADGGTERYPPGPTPTPQPTPTPEPGILDDLPVPDLVPGL